MSNAIIDKNKLIAHFKSEAQVSRSLAQEAKTHGFGALDSFYVVTKHEMRAQVYDELVESLTKYPGKFIEPTTDNASDTPFPDVQPVPKLAPNIVVRKDQCPIIGPNGRCDLIRGHTGKHKVLPQKEDDEDLWE